MSETRAVIHLRGHGSTPADAVLERYPVGVWLGRIMLYAVLWVVGTIATLVLTFDPFVASFPFVIGIGYLYHSIRGRFHLRRFRGTCPRCSEELVVKEGSKIPIPYSMTCFSCHHEPELRLVPTSP